MDIKDLILNSPQKGWKRNVEVQSRINEIIELTDFLPITSTIAERFYCILNDISEIRKCECGNNLSYSKGLSGYKTACAENGRKCLTSIRNYKEKITKTMREKYGVDNPFQLLEVKETMLSHRRENIERIKETRRQTIISKYGTENIFQTEQAKEKSRQTKKERYGNEHYNNRALFKQTVLSGFYEEKILNFTHVKPLFTKKEYEGNLEFGHPYNWICNKCGIEFDDHLKNNIPQCPICNPRGIGGVSTIEIELRDFVSSFVKIKPNERFYYDNRKYHEIDVFIPSLNIGIELNDIYWHSESQGKDKFYHLNKTIFFEKKDIQLIHIFDSEWITKQDIIKSMILSKIHKTPEKIFARKCEIKEISHAESRRFLMENHIQGNVNSADRIGLFYKDELVSLGTFSQSRYDKNHKYELLRFCNKRYLSVVGGFSRILKNFTDRFPYSLITYADRRFSTGNVYKKNGFMQLNPSEPNYFYFKPHTNVLESRIKFQKHKLEGKLEFFNPALSESDNMAMNGYEKIHDCGNLCYFLPKVNN